MTIKEALEVFKNLNAFRENPISIPPHFPEPRQLNEACEVVKNFLANAIVINVDNIKIIHDIMINLDCEEKDLSTYEYYNEVLKRYNDTRK